MSLCRREQLRCLRALALLFILAIVSSEAALSYNKFSPERGPI